MRPITKTTRHLGNTTLFCICGDEDPRLYLDFGTSKPRYNLGFGNLNLDFDFRT